jgi:hypothetical protein
MVSLGASPTAPTPSTPLPAADAPAPGAAEAGLSRGHLIWASVAVGIALLALVFGLSREDFEVLPGAPQPQPRAPATAASAQPSARPSPQPASAAPVAASSSAASPRLAEAAPPSKQELAFPAPGGARPLRPGHGPRHSVPQPLPDPVRPAGLGLLSVRSVPWARVTLDGKFIGNSPLANLPIPEGTHALVLVPSSGEFEPKHTEVRLRTGIATRVVHDFRSGALTLDQP